MYGARWISKLLQTCIVQRSYIPKGQKLKLFQRLILTKILLPLTSVCSIIDGPFQYCPTVQQFRKNSKGLTEFVEGLSFGLTEIQKGC